MVDWWYDCENVGGVLLVDFQEIVLLVDAEVAARFSITERSDAIEAAEDTVRHGGYGICVELAEVFWAHDKGECHEGLSE